MTPKERVIAALKHEEADRVPTGENAVDYELVEEILGHSTLYNSRWRELHALWDGRRSEISADYGSAHVDLVRALEWDYVRVPVVPPKKEYKRPKMTGPYSWLDENGREIQYFPDSGNIATQVDTDNNLETRIKGMFVAGDGPGVAGNIVSASATGLIPAKTILARMTQ